MTIFKDKCGKTVAIGDFIIYGQSLGRSAVLNFGRVLNIRLQEEDNWSIRIISVKETYWNNSIALAREGTLKFPDRIIRANDIIPAHIRTLLESYEKASI